MWPFNRSKYYFLTYRCERGKQVTEGWLVIRMKGTPARVANDLVRDIGDKMGAKILVTAFSIVK